MCVVLREGIQHIQSPLCTFNEKHKQFPAMCNCYQPSHADKSQIGNFLFQRLL